ncbi:hypothetical protein E8E14_012258 [Neopestalotiopsis sp. 37M]|nr:hypothetical protein E8E14_012258 [Neopestalotiopsis sp. 37M]
MSSLVCVVILLSLPLVRADFWDDFSNNLATDLAPLLSLFGERVTMQYMSESITFLDYFIFAMAPMGILTALVSAIRVCGSPSLRAFVGRAQEGAGNAEVELCSSTSRNVCELYNNGGIARVFGRPKILEVIHDPSGPEFSETAGIYTFQDYIKTSNGKALWKELGARTDMESQNEDIDSGPFAPNLSLNVGIKRKPDAIFWGVAIFGAFLQFGVLVYAGIITYYLQWVSENSSSVQYACPLTIIGTLLVCSGVFYCAYLVGESTSEKIYCRSSSSDESTPQEGTKTAVPALYWLQPGGQVLGDQTFDAFGYSDRDQPLQNYLISWKRRPEEQKRRVWEAVIMTTTGFVMQFIGLRGIHPTASIAQLGAILVMSAARASLRMQRLKPRDNFLVDCPDDVVGYELDWLALCIGRDGIQSELKLTRQEVSGNSSEETREFWEFRGTSRHILGPVQSFEEHNAAVKLLAYRTRLAELTESTSIGPSQASSTRHFKDDMIKMKSVAKQLAQALESAANLICPILCEAAGLGWAEVVLASLTSGADPDLADEALGSDTPLFHAVKNKNANVVDILIEWGASQYLRSSKGLLPLDLAVLNGHHVIVKSLLDTFDPTRVSDCRGTDIRGKTTLHIAAGQVDENIVELLIKSGKFDLDSRDDDGNTPLQIAANRLAETPVELLIDTHELRMEPENDYSLSPLDMAIFKGQEATLKMFFDVYKVDPKSRDCYGNTLLHKAVDCRQEAIVKLLIDTYHVDAESQNNERSTPLHYAANLPGTEMAQLLLETYHVDPNDTDFAAMTPLHVAIKYGRNDVAKLLLDAGHVNRESRADQGLTPLHWAMRSPDGQIARLLIETYNVDPDVKDNDGRTPLEHAILAENLNIVDFMVNVSGEETRAKALLLAEEKGYDKVTDLLARKEEQLGSSGNN